MYNSVRDIATLLGFQLQINPNCHTISLVLFYFSIEFIHIFIFTRSFQNNYLRADNLSCHRDTAQKICVQPLQYCPPYITICVAIWSWPYNSNPNPNEMNILYWFSEQLRNTIKFFLFELLCVLELAPPVIKLSIEIHSMNKFKVTKRERKKMSVYWLRVKFNKVKSATSAFIIIQSH